MRVIKEIYRQFDSFDGRLFRYALAFSLLLAIAPILIALILVFQNSIILNEGAAEVLVSVLIQYLPRDIIVPFVEWFSGEGEPIGFWATISTLAISFYLASRSIYSFLLISAQVEKVKVPAVYIRLRAILLTVYFALYLCVFYCLVVVFERVWLILTAILAIVLFMCMYHARSFYHRPMMYGIVGSLFSVCSFVILGAVLTKMLETFTSYSTVYGPMASFMTLLLSIYIIACIIYLGFCVHIVLEETADVSECELKRGILLRLSVGVLSRIGRKRGSYESNDKENGDQR